MVLHNHPTFHLQNCFIITNNPISSCPRPLATSVLSLCMNPCTLAPHRSEIIYCLFFCIWLMSPSTMFSRCIHPVAWVGFPSSVRLNNTPLCACTAFGFSTAPLMDIRTGCTFGHCGWCCHEHGCASPYLHPCFQLQDHIILFIFSRNPQKLHQFTFPPKKCTQVPISPYPY